MSHIFTVRTPNTPRVLGRYRTVTAAESGVIDLVNQGLTVELYHLGRLALTYSPVDHAIRMQQAGKHPFTGTPTLRPDQLLAREIERAVVALGDQPAPPQGKRKQELHALLVKLYDELDDVTGAAAWANAVIDRIRVYLK